MWNTDISPRDANNVPAIWFMQNWQFVTVSAENPLPVSSAPWNPSWNPSWNLSLKELEKLKEDLIKEINKPIIEEEGEIEIARDIPSNLPSVSNTTSWAFHTPNTYFVWKIVTHVWFEKAWDGILHVMRIKKSWESFEVIKEIELTVSGTWQEWFEVDFWNEPFWEDEWIWFTKAWVSTAKFKYGWVWSWFRTSMNSTGFISNSNSTFWMTELWIWYKVKTPRNERTLFEEVEKIFEKEKQKNRFFGKKFSFTWDSITTLLWQITAWNAVYYNTDRVATFWISEISDTWWGQLCNLCEAKFYKNDAWSGSRVSGATNAGLAHSRTGKIPSDTDYLFILIWINDMSWNVPLGEFNKEAETWWVDTISDAYCKMITDFQKNLPNTKIYALTPLRAFTSEKPRKNASWLTVPALGQRIMEICQFFGVECIDTWEIWWNQWNKSRVLPDWLHPNKQGAKEIAEFIYNKII